MSALKRARRESDHYGRKFGEEASLLNDLEDLTVERIFHRHGEGGRILLKWAEDKKVREDVMTSVKDNNPTYHHMHDENLGKAAAAAKEMEPVLDEIVSKLQEDLQQAMAAKNVLVFSSGFVKEVQKVQTADATTSISDHTKDTMEACCKRIDFRRSSLKDIGQQAGITSLDVLEDVPKEKRMVLITFLKKAHDGGLHENEEWRANVEQLIAQGVVHMPFSKNRIYHGKSMCIESVFPLCGLYLNVPGSRERPEGTKFQAKHDMQKGGGYPWCVEPDTDVKSTPASASSTPSTQQYGYNPMAPYHYFAPPSPSQGHPSPFQAQGGLPPQSPASQFRAPGFQGGLFLQSSSFQGAGNVPYQHSSPQAATSVGSSSLTPSVPPVFSIGSYPKPASRKKSRASIPTLTAKPTTTDQTHQSDSMQM